jgi:two-component system invasion response regulator UvrY
MIRVLTVDDHPLIRKGVRHLLSDLPEFGPVEEAEDAVEALRKLNEQQWDLILLDLTLQGGDGFDLLYEIRRRFPKLPVLILSMHPEGALALRALR